MKLDSRVVGNAGLYFTCFHLLFRGWNAMPTARNARGIDIVAHSLNGSRFVGVQVDALRKRNPVPLGKSLEKMMGDLRVIVNNIATEPGVFVLLPNEVTKLAHRGERDG